MSDETRKVLRRIADLVSEAQRQKGLSTAELARRSGVSRDVVEGLMRAEGDVGIDVIYRLAGALDIRPSDLIVGIEWDPGEGSGGRWRVSGEESR